MRIRDRLDEQRPSLSFEFFPPKDDVGFWDLYRTIEALKPLDPTYVSVTYRALNEPRKTLELVARIKSDIGIESMAHMTCFGHSRYEIGQAVDELRARGIENVLALRGDPSDASQPGGKVPAFTPTEDGFRYASELVAFIRDRCEVCIGAACYPEGHPEAPNPQLDLDNLKRKAGRGGGLPDYPVVLRQ